MKAVFTKEELNQLPKKNLAKLAGYYKIELNNRDTKGEIIDKILEFLYPSSSKSGEEGTIVEELSTKKRSVRIQRIWDSRKK